MEYEMKISEMGRVAIALLELHLENPEKFDALTIVEKMFDKFEELELEAEE